MSAPVIGLLSVDGRLISADEALLHLQLDAGSSLGDPVAMPAIARLAALAARANHLVEKPVRLADRSHDISAFARVAPDGENLRIEMTDWVESPARRWSPTDTLLATHSEATLVEWACDVRLRCVMVAPRGGITLSRDHWLGTPLAQLFQLHPDDAGQMPLLNALALQQPFAAQPATLSDAQGRAHDVQLQGQPMFAEGELTGFTGTARGLIRRTPQPEQAGSGAHSGSAFDAVDPRRFALRVDGAMRRPLGRIIANAETIAGQLDGPIRREYLGYAQDIVTASRHLLDLVDDLSDLQAIERTDFSAAHERVDLADVGRRAAGLLALRAQEKGMRIDAPALDESVPADGEFRRVLQILLNLIGNAIRYAPENSAIWVRVASENDRAQITVADQGPGISPDDQERLFAKFERLGRTDSAGSGLGLYISRRLAQAMGGDITLDSAPGQGARFTLDLPVWNAG